MTTTEDNEIVCARVETAATLNVGLGVSFERHRHLCRDEPPALPMRLDDLGGYIACLLFSSELCADVFWQRSPFFFFLTVLVRFR